jgi:hypothetical protein
MAKLQLSNKNSKTMPARDTGVLDVFRTADYDGDDWYMRVTPVSYLTNSTTIKENIAKGKVLVVNLGKGTLQFIKGDEPVVNASSVTVSVDA